MPLVPKNRHSEPEILIVDDSILNIDVLRQFLEPSGYRISVATSGRDALENAPDTMPDLILLDVMMPQIDGFETCRRLKALEATQHIPVIFVTARDKEADIVAGFRVGGVDYITKPIKKEEVTARVRTHLALREYSRTVERDAERFRAIVNNIAEAIVIIDDSGAITFVNPAAEHFFVHAASDLVGRSIDYLVDDSLFPTDYDVGSPPGVSTRATTYGGYRSKEVRIRRGDGTTSQVDLTINAAFLDTPFYIALFRDIGATRDELRRVTQMSQLDHLTGLANRRHCDETLEREWARALEKQAPLALLYLDIDHFKLYNDHYGHLKGDACLQKVAATMNREVGGSNNLVARFGGEEFVCLLPGCDESQAREVGERVRIAIEGLEIPHADSPVESVSGVVTSSIGVAAMVPKKERGEGALINRADAGLYWAKLAGRNQLRCSRHYSCFLSHASADEAFAKTLHADLQNNGVRCWLAREDMEPGSKIAQQLDSAIHRHEKLLLIISEASMSSKWVAAEIRWALEGEEQPKLFPVTLASYDVLQRWRLLADDGVTDLAAEVRQYFIPDFSDWHDLSAYHHSVERLLQGLKLP